jgi:hypothetical protein
VDHHVPVLRQHGVGGESGESGRASQGKHRTESHQVPLFNAAGAATIRGAASLAAIPWRINPDFGTKAFRG